MTTLSHQRGALHGKACTASREGSLNVTKTPFTICKSSYRYTNVRDIYCLRNRLQEKLKVKTIDAALNRCFAATHQQGRHVGQGKTALLDGELGFSSIKSTIAFVFLGCQQLKNFSSSFVCMGL